MVLQADRAFVQAIAKSDKASLGKLLDAETRAQLRDLGGDEDAVFVPANVIDRIKGLA